MKRRNFLGRTSAVLAAAASSLVNAPNVIAQPKIQWRLPTMWPPSLDILQGTCHRFAKIVDDMSGGRFKIQVFAAGELMPATGVFDACSQGSVQAYSGAAYYWAGKEPGFQWFTSAPFGLNAQGYYAWYHHGDGLKLYEEGFAPFNVVPRPAQGTSPQMTGWFRKKITSVDDLKGLKIRIPGLGGKVYARAGAAVVLLPPGELYTALERGTIDAVEFIGPHDDMKLGFQQAARYYYYPGWHEATSIAEFGFNKKAYEALPAELRAILDHAASEIQVVSVTEYFWKNSLGMERLRTQFKDKVEILRLPDAVIEELRKLSTQAMLEEAGRSPLAKKVYDSYTKVLATTAEWSRVEGAYYSTLTRS